MDEDNDGIDDWTSYGLYKIKRSPNTTNVLVCGWRPTWTSNPGRLKARLMDMTQSMDKGTTITFLNQMNKEAFKEIMASMEDKVVPVPEAEQSVIAPHIDKDSAWKLPEDKQGKGIHLYHKTGDATDFEFMVNFIFADPETDPATGERKRGQAPKAKEAKYQYHSALVFGTQAIPVDGDSGESRDTRVLTILLILRSLCAERFGYKKKVHIITEIGEDQTALLALPPVVAGDFTKPDFVNTESIYARTLALGLAYPQINVSMGEIFLGVQAGDGTPMLDLIDMKSLGLVGQSVPFGTIQYLVNELFDGYAVAIGFLFKGGDMLLAPTLEAVGPKTHTPKAFDYSAKSDGPKPKYVAEDKVVLLRREFEDSEAHTGETASFY